MVNISKFGDSAIKFKFTDNDHYLFNGEIEVPINSLLLVLDESDMVTFKKIDGDPFVSFLISNSNFESKETLIDFYIANMVGSGNSESGITSGDVESMIEASLQDYYDIDEIDAALSGKADSSAVTEAINSAVSGKADTSAVTESINAAVSGKADSADIVDITSFGTQNSDTLIMTREKNGSTIAPLTVVKAGSGLTISSDAWANKSFDVDTTVIQEKLVSGTNIKTINNESILGSGNITIEGGGGKAVSGGTNISITTGETADTINCTLPITATSSAFSTISIGKDSGGGEYNTLIGPNAKCDSNSRHNVFLVAQYSTASNEGSYVKGSNNVIIGSMKTGYPSWDIPSFSTSQSVVIGGGQMSTDKNNSLAIGYNANVSGTTKTNINNQLTIDTSNQVHISNSANTSTYCLQEKIENTEAALGGLKLVKLSQSEYDNLATKDNSTLYVIVN